MGLVSGCAQRPEEITASYVSPIPYEGLSCEQLFQEGERVSSRAAELTGTQQQKAQNDAVAMGVGLVLFWPALFFVKGDRETANQLSRLKGEMEAIEQASIRKSCGFTIQSAQG
jgi:hypothetical protein